ncbi:GNAT family N-acetyltransferase [Bacillus sp. Marseille-Q1617]|uniref:GNAT family N-acetyltransferase n=1 Tax=Bacillus sp. Marseille-Q1617 TaxID=2736887 RepID=UPI00158E7914|nr:GNAT family N-acetyltransferase [Bacillus sp. Marseille-Q1617]
MLDLLLRRPETADKDEIHRLFRTVITDTFWKEGIIDQDNDLEEEIKTKQYYLEDDFQSSGKERFFLIALEAGKIIGTIEYGPASPLIIKCTDNNFQHLHEVGTVFIHPDYQRKGIGNILLQEIYHILQSNDINEFCLDSGYRRSQKIWKRKFGEPDYLLKDYWGKEYHHMIWYLNVHEIIKNSKSQSK